MPRARLEHAGAGQPTGRLTWELYNACWGLRSVADRAVKKSLYPTFHPRSRTATERKRIWYQQNAERAREAARQDRAENPEKARIYRETHQEQQAAYAHRWKKENPDKNRVRANRYYARRQGAAGDYTLQEWEAPCARYGYRCLCCGQQKPLSADHIVPVSKGGANTIDNIQPLCKPCNSRKGDKTIDYRT